MKLIPQKNYVVVKPILKEDKTETGILLPGIKSNSAFAEVVEIGDEVNSLNINDKVVYNDNGKNVTLDGENYIVLKEDDIIAKVK